MDMDFTGNLENYKYSVIPEKTGTQSTCAGLSCPGLGSRFRGNDGGGGSQTQ
ncbi:MAG: hypothetical protein QG656_1190 [Candidatus Hydrogenedentes bacterium]|nr:hypothetical protein [Candidatus Hydrogenedentota bacterium]